MRRDNYVRLFNDPEIEGFAVRLMHDGFSHAFIGRLLDCDRTSVYALQKRKEKNGMVFKKFKVSIDREYKVTYREIKRQKEYQERISKRPRKPTMKFFKPVEGTTYAEYIAIDNEKTKNARMERIAAGKETIRKVRIKRALEEEEEKRSREEFRLKKHG
jgi:hypothetical protein